MPNHTDISQLPPDLSQYTWRSIERGDAAALNHLLLDVADHDRTEEVDTLEDRQRDFDDPATNLKTDSLLVQAADGQVIAFGWIFAPSEADLEYAAFLWGEVHPDHRGRGLEDFILNWMEARGRQIMAERPTDLPHYLKVWCKDHLVERIALFESHGFSLARSYYRMRRDLHQPISRTYSTQGIRITGWQIERDGEAFNLLNEAFRDHWGFIPMDETSWRLFMTGHPDFRPELSFMALAQEERGDEKLVGLSLNRVRAAENTAHHIQEGWIAELAVLRPWRKRGIATALLTESMEAFKSAGLDYAGLGVDTANLTGALRIYENAGFVPIQRTLSFSKVVIQ